jgi:hypothetical protein
LTRSHIPVTFCTISFSSYQTQLRRITNYNITQQIDNMKNHFSLFTSTTTRLHSGRASIVWFISLFMPTSKWQLSLMMVLWLFMGSVEQTWGQALYDSYTDGDFTASPVWGGSAAEWTIVTNSDAAAGTAGSNTLRLNAPPVDQTDYLSSQLANWGNAQEWNFYVGRRAQPFTASNQMFIWLYANESTLNGTTVDGYRIAIGDDSGSDEIRLQYIVDGAVNTTVITSSGALANGLVDIGFLMRVTRSTSGLWAVYTSTLPVANGTGAVATDIPNAANTPAIQGTATHNTLVPAASGYLGVAALHSTSADAIAAVEFDQFYFSASSTTDYFRSRASGNWNNALTWESSPVSDFSSGLVSPATLAPDNNANTVTIRSGHNVTLSAPVTADQIVVDAGGTFTHNDNLTLANGAGDDLTVNGLWVWNSFSLTGAGNAIVSNTGTLNLETVTAKYLGASLTNNGIMDWKNGVINFFSSATLTNNATWNITGTNTTSYGDSYGNIVNNGTITKTSIGFSDFAFVQTFLNNMGATINCNAGEMRFGGAGNPIFTNAGALAFNGGMFTINGGATFHYSTGSSVSGTGTFNNNGVLELNISVVFPSTMNVTNTIIINGPGDLTINSDFVIQGQINGPGTLTVNGNTTWINGLLNREFVVENTRTLTINTASDKSLKKNLTNNGTIDWQNGAIFFYSLPTITNTALWLISGNNITTTGDNYAVITNTGTITKTSSGTTDFTYISNFTNSGTINFNAGNLRLGGLASLTFNNGGVLAFNGGALTSNAGTTFNYNSLSSISGTGAFTNNSTLNLNVNAVFPSGINVVNTVTINGPGNLTINSDFIIQGQILGAGTLTINANSTWIGGVLGRVFTVDNTRTLTLNTATDKYLSANLTNNGTMNWQAGLIAFSNSPTITNSALWNITGNNSTTQFLTPGTINNTTSGIITKTSSGTSSFTYVTTFTNSGTLNFNGGTTAVGGLGSTTFTNTGALAFSNGAFTIQNGTAFNYNTGSTVTGSGTFTNASLLTLNTHAVFPAGMNVVNNGTFTGVGNLTLNSDFVIQSQFYGPGILTINANSFWIYGTLGRQFTVDATRTLTINTSNDKYLQANLTNNGTIVWQHGNIIFDGFRTITNNNIWSITGDRSLSSINSSFGTINNVGTITKTSTGTTSLGWVTLLTNSGTINCNAGILNFGGAGATTFTNIGTLSFAGGTFNGSAGVTFNHNANAIIKGTGTFIHNTTFNRNGIISPGASPGILAMNGTEPFSASTTINIEVLDNSGPGTGHDQITRLTGVTLAGTLNVTETGSVSPGTFTILTASSITGTGFTVENLPACYTRQVVGNTVQLTKSAVPVVTCPANSTVCITTPAYALSGGMPAGGVYSGPGVSAGNFDPAIAGAGTHTITYTVTEGNMCINTCNFTITVDAQPIAIPGVGGNECDLTFEFNATPSVGLGTWTDAGPGTATYLPNANAPNATVTVTAYGTYTFTWTEVNGTCSDDDFVVVNFYEQPVVSDQPNQAQCNDGSFTMTQSPASVGTGVWTLVAGTATITTPGSPTTTITGVAAGASATVRWTVTNGSCSAFDEVTVTNEEQPIVSNQPDQAQCNIGSFTMTQSMPSIGMGVWTLISGSGIITTPGSPTTTITGVGAGANATVRWTVTNGSCSASDEVTVTNDEQPIVSDQPNQAQCNSGSFAMTQSPASVGTAVWTLISGTATISTPGSPTTAITGVGAGTSATVRWTVTNGACSAYDEVIVTHNALPVVTCPGNLTVCVDDPAFALTGATPAMGSYSGDGVSGGMFDPATAGPGSHIITYTYTDDNGCTNTCTFTISVSDAEVSVTSVAFLIDIMDGDNTPDVGDDTEFGSADVSSGSVTHSFSINNDGTTPLTVSSISLTGANPGDFAIGTLTPASPIPPSSSSNFTITFNPIATGQRTATVNIANNDCNTPSFDFAIQGTGTSASCTAIVNVNTSETFCTIQAAIDDPQTLNGHVITVAAGTYPEHVIITKGLDIRGPNYGISGTSMSRVPEASIVPEATLMPGDPWTEVVFINADNVSLDGFKISGDNPAITGHAYAGMDLDKGQCVYSEGDNVQFRNNIVEKATTMGFFAGGAQVSPQYADLVVTNNKFEHIHDINQLGYGFAMYIQATTGLISGNTVENSRTGIQVQPYDVINPITPVVTGNTFNVWRSGIYYNYAENNASAWSIHNNTINAINPPVTPTGPVRWQGISAETIRSSSNGGIITGNIVNGNNLSNPLYWWTTVGLQYTGTSSTSTALSYSNNTVSGVGYGLVHDAPADITVTANNLAASTMAIAVQRAYSSAGVQQLVGGTGNMNATGGNTINGVVSGSATLAQLYAIEDAIYHKSDSCLFGLVRVIPNQIYVTVNSSSIQCGIDAAAVSGDMVNIKGGTYTSSGMDASARSVALAPGSSPGCVTLGGNMVLDGSDDLVMELNGTLACTTYDRFIVNGTVTLGGADLVATLGYVPSNGDAYTIIANDLADPVVGQFSQLNAIVIGGYPYVINYAGGDGNDVVLEMCTGVTTISTPTLVVQNTPMLPASVPDVGVGTYVWSITNGTITGGQGTSSISYTSGTAGTLTISVTVTDANGCVSTDNQVVSVIVAGSSTMQWVQDNAAHGSCPAATNCNTNVICFGLEYTPGVSGNLNTYTTGFKTECLGNIPVGITPVMSNQSCVMNDNSFELNACSTIDSILFNSSGNAGMVPVVAGTPMIIHKVCFDLDPPLALGIKEDLIINLSASIELAGGGQYTEYPMYTTTSLSKAPPSEVGGPVPTSSTVECVEFATPPVPLPVVHDLCGTPLTGVLLSMVDTGPMVCSGTRVYTYRFTDSSGLIFDWSYTYTIDDNTAPTGTAPAAITGVNGCLPTQTEANDAFSAILAASGYTDNCTGSTVAAALTSAVVTGNNCAWMITYTFSVADNCGNALPGQVYTRSGNDQTAPTGTAPTAITGVNSCLPTQLEAITAFNASLAATGYVDNCSGNTVTAALTSALVTGDHCSWMITYTFSVADNCGNVLPGQVYTRSGSDQTAPTGTAPTAITGVNSCLPTQLEAITDFDPIFAEADYTDNCSGNTVSAALTSTISDWR